MRSDVDNDNNWEVMRICFEFNHGKRRKRDVAKEQTNIGLQLSSASIVRRWKTKIALIVFDEFLGWKKLKNILYLKEKLKISIFAHKNMCAGAKLNITWIKFSRNCFFPKKPFSDWSWDFFFRSLSKQHQKYSHKQKMFEMSHSRVEREKKVWMRAELWLSQTHRLQIC